MEANNRFREQTFEFEQANEELDRLIEIAVGRQLSLAIGEEGPTQVEDCLPPKGCKGPGSGLCREDQETTVEY